MCCRASTNPEGMDKQPTSSSGFGLSSLGKIVGLGKLALRSDARKNTQVATSIKLYCKNVRIVKIGMHQDSNQTSAFSLSLSLFFFVSFFPSLIVSSVLRLSLWSSCLNAAPSCHCCPTFSLSLVLSLSIFTGPLFYKTG